MPRVPRQQSAPGAMRPGTPYHVTSHAVAGTWLFETARDRIVFLSLLDCHRRTVTIGSPSGLVRRFATQPLAPHHRS